MTSGTASPQPWARAFDTPIERVLALGTPRTDFFDVAALEAAKRRTLATYPALAGRRVIAYAPTFRGRGRLKRPAAGFDASRLRAALGPDDALVLKSHPNLDRALVATAGFDVIVDPASEMNDLLLAATDVLITDYSSSIFEWALLHRPLILLVPDLAEYERDPGLYLDLRTAGVGTLVEDMDGLVAAVSALSARSTASAPTPLAVATQAFIDRHLGACDGRASERFVEHFLPAGVGA